MDPGLYLDSDTAAFFKKEIGIDDDVSLKEHIIAVQADAYKHVSVNTVSNTYISIDRILQVHPYPCIRGFFFTMSVPPS